MSTYLITGGAGFIGSHLCEFLCKNGHRVINIDNFSDLYDYRIKIQNIMYFFGADKEFNFCNKEEDLKKLPDIVNGPLYRLEVIDIRDSMSMERIFQEEKIDAVIHLAAMPGVRASIEQPLLFEDVNVRGTLHLLELMKKYGIKKWVCASSSSVYGNNRKVPFSESDSVGTPISLYAATKRNCELMGYTYYHLFNIDTVMLRFFTVYGERQRPDLAIHKFTRMIDEGIGIPFYGDGSTKRDYTYVGDIVDGIQKALRYVEQNEEVYEIINLGGHHTVSLQCLVETLEEQLGKKAIINELPMQPGDMDQTCADNRKAQDLIGFEPKTAFHEGIINFINWFRGERYVGTISCRPCVQRER
ncbi:GDP-mannose 4,6-dehydratase [Bacillus sp. 165]|uniref:GDP-mannose 4,6-dehydratase n=1 Tax=Bacillus sp. 165 TaxID=1529117 RepID=UPI001ADBFF42|nr:GDP-mannose 4,6-dehydratase [Bacillus sp. 165]MBO9131211.1 GDP-mannose 4,6-dehydratase [Bacillus sp. 165]